MKPETINLDRRGVAVRQLYGHVVLDADGKPALRPARSEATRWYTILARLENKGVLLVEVSRVTDHRTNKQNALLWAGQGLYAQVLDGLRELALEAGEVCPFGNVQAVHEAMKHRFIGAASVMVAGERMEIPATTTKLSIEQFSAYVRAISEWAATKGIYVDLEEQ